MFIILTPPSPLLQLFPKEMLHFPLPCLHPSWPCLSLYGRSFPFFFGSAKMFWYLACSPSGRKYSVLSVTLGSLFACWFMQQFIPELLLCSRHGAEHLTGLPQVRTMHSCLVPCWVLSSWKGMGQDLLLYISFSSASKVLCRLNLKWNDKHGDHMNYFPGGEGGQQGCVEILPFQYSQTPAKRVPLLFQVF